MDSYDEILGLIDLKSSSIDDKDSLYKSVGSNLMPDEKEYIKSQIKKDCNNCANMSCRVEQYEKPISNCIGWENNRIIGEYKVLKLMKK